ncbi:MAG: RNA polymerase subunit sigma-70 [Chloroflexi bacterium RBG_16_51_9]|nr:MAG: RNA polymerase subunit sigma-70 [Chloroflexi bacterium RBG_16_51_9]
MSLEWNELTKITQGAEIVIERVRLVENKVAIEGEFELPRLARLSAEDQVFIMAFIQCHGSIKDMEKMFGISYPTVKNRLNRLAEMLKLVETRPSPSRADVLAQLESGEINASQAIERLSK